MFIKLIRHSRFPYTYITHVANTCAIAGVRLEVFTTVLVDHAGTEAAPFSVKGAGEDIVRKSGNVSWLYDTNCLLFPVSVQIFEKDCAVITVFKLEV